MFAVGGGGDYRLRPVHVDDLAQLCVTLGTERTDTIVDAVGPDRPTFVELVHAIRDAVESRAAVVSLPGRTMPLLARVLGILVHDVLLTTDEYRSMADGLADTDGPATGDTSVLTWVRDHGGVLGVRYANELDRHFT